MEAQPEDPTARTNRAGSRESTLGNSRKDVTQPSDDPR
jgi:hypothetical protein